MARQAAAPVAVVDQLDVVAAPRVAVVAVQVLDVVAARAVPVALADPVVPAVTAVVARVARVVAQAAAMVAVVVETDVPVRIASRVIWSRT